MGLAAVEAAVLNVRVNATGLDDTDLAARYQNDAQALAERARAIREAVIAVVEDRAGLV